MEICSKIRKARRRPGRLVYLHYAHRARKLQVNLLRDPIGLQVSRKSHRATLECYLAVPAWPFGSPSGNRLSKPFLFDHSRDIVRLVLRSLFCDIAFKTWLKGLVESAYKMLDRVSHLKIENAYTHFPRQELEEGSTVAKVGVDFTKNGRGALKYFSGLKRLTICAGPMWYPRSWCFLDREHVLLASAELKDEFAIRLVEYFKVAAAYGRVLQSSRDCLRGQVVRNARSIIFVRSLDT